MNPKIGKIRAEIEKNRTRIAAWQEKNRALEKQLQELENLDIVGIVREMGVSPEELAALLGKKLPAKKPEKEDENAEKDPA